MDNFGLSFSPTNQDRMTGQGGSQPSAGGASNPIQDAIRTLSYRIPKQTGGQGLAPNALLNGAGSAGLGMGGPSAPPSVVGPQTGAMGAGMGGGANPVMAGLEEWLRKIFAQQGQGGSLMAPNAPMGGAPAPHVTPGADGRMPQTQGAATPPQNPWASTMEPQAPVFNNGTDGRIAASPLADDSPFSKPAMGGAPDPKQSQINKLFK